LIKARITVTLKNGVLDPQGKAIEHALQGLGFEGVGSVRQGKVIDLELAGTDRAGPRPNSRRCATGCSPRPSSRTTALPYREARGPSTTADPGARPTARPPRHPKPASSPEQFVKKP